MLCIAEMENMSTPFTYFMDKGSSNFCQAGENQICAEGLVREVLQDAEYLPQLCARTTIPRDP